MPIGIVAYAFTLSWDNLCRNSCKQDVLKRFRGKHAMEKCFFLGTKFSRHPEGLSLRVCGFQESTDFHFAKYRFPFRKVQIFISQSTDFHFAKYSFHFAKYRFSFRKVQIFISQSTDFISFRFVSQSTISQFKLLGGSIDGSDFFSQM